jgi:hypothetical protein
MHLYDVYEKEGVQGVANSIGTNIVHDNLSSLQTDAVWATIGQFVPKEYHDTGKRMLANVMGTVTTAEIKLAKQFLQPSKSPQRAAHRTRTRSMQIEAIGAPYHKDHATRRPPKEVKYV